MKNNSPKSKVKDCKKCDERGMIADKKIKGAASSCNCGYANKLMQEQLKDVPLENLIAYLNARHAYKLPYYE